MQNVSHEREGYPGNSTALHKPPAFYCREIYASLSSLACLSIVSRHRSHFVSEWLTQGEVRARKKPFLKPRKENRHQADRPGK